MADLQLFGSHPRHISTGPNRPRGPWVLFEVKELSPGRTHVQAKETRTRDTLDRVQGSSYCYPGAMIPGITDVLCGLLHGASERWEGGGGGGV